MSQVESIDSLYAFIVLFQAEHLLPSQFEMQSPAFAIQYPIPFLHSNISNLQFTIQRQLLERCCSFLKMSPLVPKGMML